MSKNIRSCEPANPFLSFVSSSITPEQQSEPANLQEPVPPAVEAFIARWSKSGASERANYQLFLSELCTILGVPLPNPSVADDPENTYVFERRVPSEVRMQKSEVRSESKESDPIRNSQFDTRTSYGYIDLYRRGAFVLETKQGVERKDDIALSEAGREREAKTRKGHGVRGTDGWSAALIKARNQADRYARNLPASEGRPPFLIVADVGHCIELYAEFPCSGGIYTPFPADRSSRIMLDDLRRPEIRERLRLDPSRRTAAVTREISAKLAALAKSLEKDGHDPQLAAYFLMRCIFTMFSEDVELIPKGSFSEMLKSLRGQVNVVPAMLENLWKAMDGGEFFPAIWFRKKLLRFNGGLFRDPRALAITDDQLELLIEAAKADWRDVEPAIFGTLLERALEPTERHKLGAHYTPRAYVERLVLPTVIEPLRADWQAVQAAAVQHAHEDKKKKALEEIEKFHRHLCEIRVLDPACGTGNFLYVTLEHLKRLEGEVLDTLERFGGNRSLEMDTATVRPSQMRGIEINPRAAVIAELVLWIGYLQWHLRTNGAAAAVSEPVLEDARNIETRDAILTYDNKSPVRVEAASSRFSSGETKRQDAASTLQEETYTYFNPLREVKVTESNLPHWRQDGVTYFVTFRLADSLPQERLQQWQVERDEWLARNPTPHTDEQKADYFDRFSARMEMWLDAGHGACCLKDPACRQIVEGAFKHFDGDRYILGKHAVAKNHVHVIVTPKGGHELSDIVHSWKSYTANEINKHLKRSGTVWQKEFYDHIIRSPNAAYRIEQYIAKHEDHVEAASSRFSSDADKRQDAASTANPPIYLTHWDGRTTKPHPVTGRPVPDEHAQLPIYSYENPRPAKWPEADYIVGNPPFIGNKRMRDALGDGYVEAVRKTIKSVPESADFVMYWWNHAGDLVRAGKARRFRFVTTNSIRQTFNRRVLVQHLTASDKGPKTKDKGQVSLIFAIPDHPWVDDVEAAAVRVAMTVAEAGNASGMLQKVESEEPGDESFKIQLREQIGKIAADLTLGADTTSAVPLKSNAGISFQGCKLVGSGFQISRDMRDQFLSDYPTIASRLPAYFAGRDLTVRWNERYVIDLTGLTRHEASSKLPTAYQYLLDHVKPDREQCKRKAHRENWWLFGEKRTVFRAAMAAKSSYMATSEVAKHRTFVKLPWPGSLPDGSLVAIASDDDFILGVVSSRTHLIWALAQGGRMGMGNDPRYNHSRCFETFPFPDCTDEQKARIRELGEALDAHRKSRQAAHPDLTMTGMYNVLEKLRSGDSFSAKEKTTHEHGLVSILKQLHDDLDAAVADAYGWPADLSDEEILTHLVALNHERAEEEKRGLVRWLRPDYQTRGQKSEDRSQQQEMEGVAPASKPSTKNQERQWFFQSHCPTKSAPSAPP